MLVAFCVVVLAPALASAGCNNPALAGSWDYTYTGTIFTPGGPLPLASIGHFRMNQSGNLSGSQARSVAGASGTEDINGTIAVGRDCSATSTVNVLVNGQLQRTSNLALVFDSDGKHVRGIFQSLTLSDGTNVPVVITIEGNKINSNN